MPQEMEPQSALVAGRPSIEPVPTVRYPNKLSPIAPIEEPHTVFTPNPLVAAPNLDDVEGLDDAELPNVLDDLDVDDVQGAVAVFSEVFTPAVLAARAGGLEDVLVDEAKDAVKGKAKDWFKKWWRAYMEAMLADEMIDGWITSPFHEPLVEADVRVMVRNQIVAIKPESKQKLVKRLRARAKRLRDRAAKAAPADAQRYNAQADAFDWAADEVNQSLPANERVK